MPITDEDAPKTGTKEEQKLEHIRKRWDYHRESWEPIYAEGDTDMDFVSGDPWPAAAKQSRNVKGNERPCLVFDELSQHLNREINNWRSNQRSIKVTPAGSGATDKTAELRAGIIKAIEYKSKAETVYTTAFENALQRSWGFVEVDTYYSRPGSFDQSLCVKGVENPRNIYIDPDSVEPDGSDMMDAFQFKPYTHDAFRRKWGKKAEFTSFTPEMMARYPSWLTAKRVIVAKYWEVEIETKTLLGVEGFNDAIYEDDLPEGFVVDGKFITGPDGVQRKIIAEREDEIRTVVNYVTNGLEILERQEWTKEITRRDGTKRRHGTRIPIAPMWGKRMYTGGPDGSTQLTILSLIRLARDPAMLYNYLRSNEQEVIGMVPKVPYSGAVGQFDTSTPWDRVGKEPMAYVEYDPSPESANGAILGPPVYTAYEPPIQAFEIGAESCRRAIQNAIGSFVGSPDRRDTNVRSGIGLKKLEEQTNLGNFHFTDNGDRCIEQVGCIIDDLLPIYYDLEREEEIRKPDDTSEVRTLNRRVVNPQDGSVTIEDSFEDGEHTVTIGTGPSSASLREDASAFADLLASNPVLFQAALAGDASARKTFALAVRLKNGGAIMDSIADLFDPKDQEQLPPAALAKIQELTQQAQALDALAKQQQEELQQLKSGAMVKAAEIEARKETAAQQDQTKLHIATTADATKERIAQAQIAADERMAHLEARIDLLIETMRDTLEEKKLHVQDRQQRRQAEHEHEMADHNASLQPDEVESDS